MSKKEYTEQEKNLIRAVLEISKYCDDREHCNGCIFFGAADAAGCLSETPPCDWKIPCRSINRTINAVASSTQVKDSEHKPQIVGDVPLPI